MRNLFLILFIFAANTSYSQKVSVKEIPDKNIVEMLSNVEQVTIKKGRSLRISFFIVNNGSGSAYLPESDEASHSIFLAVSEYDENPQARVFKASPLINPQIIDSKDMDNVYSVSVEHGIAGKRKVDKLLISLDRAVFE